MPGLCACSTKLITSSDAPRERSESRTETTRGGLEPPGFRAERLYGAERWNETLFLAELGLDEKDAADLETMLEIPKGELSVSEWLGPRVLSESPFPGWEMAGMHMLEDCSKEWRVRRPPTPPDLAPERHKSEGACCIVWQKDPHAVCPTDPKLAEEHCVLMSTPKGVSYELC